MKQVSLWVFFILFVISCGPSYHIADINEGKYRISESNNISEDQEIVELIEPYKEGLTQQMTEVINTVPKTLSKGKPESTLGNWMADLLNEYAEQNYNQPIALTIQNYGGIRINNLSKGPLEVQKVYEIMPFDNELGIVKMKGKELMQLLQNIAKSGGWPVSHQLQMTIDGNNAITKVTIKGEKIIEDNFYNVVMSDYIAFGGDSMDFIKDITFIPLNSKVRDVMIHQIKVRNYKGQEETATLDNRIKQVR